MPPKIVDWSSIANQFATGLVLGNGASMAFDPRFSYRSLRGEAETRALITKDVQRIFDRLRTSDFELVLRVLWHAQTVNEALSITDKKTATAYRSVRRALIEVVRNIHPAFSSIQTDLQRAADFMSRFETVASLSYDVLVYWAMQLANRAMTNRFKDCFLHGTFGSDWEDLRKPYGTNTKATLVFYPHGNIAIGADIAGVEKKIHSKVLASLLTTIFGEWRSGSVTPVFVSEGTSPQKRASIRRSPYLTAVLDEVLPAIGPTVVLHGWSLRSVDDHLLDAICAGDEITDVAVGVNPSSPRLDEDTAKVRTKLELRLRRRSFRLIFYDRSSSGCWIMP